MAGQVKKNKKNRFDGGDFENDAFVEREKRKKQKSGRRSEARERRRNKEHHDGD